MARKDGGFFKKNSAKYWQSMKSRDVLELFSGHFFRGSYGSTQRVMSLEFELP